MESSGHLPPDAEDLVPDLAYGFEHDLFEDRVQEAALQALYAGVADPEIRSLLTSPVRRARLQEQLGQGGSPFRCPRLKGHDLVLGRDERGRSVGIRARWLNAGFFLGGNTGSGKTTLVKLLLLQVARSVKGLWATDLYKRDLRHLRPLLARYGIRLIVLPHTLVKRNVLQPDGDPRSHIALVLDALQRALDLPGRAMTILRTALHELYERFDVFQGEREAYPTLYNLYEYVKHASGANAPARTAILDRLGALLVSLTPEVAAYRYAWKPSDLATHHIVFEMSGASEQVKSLLLSDLLFPTLYGRVQAGRSNASLDLVLVLEDAQRLLSGGSTASGELPPLEELAGLIRGMGISFWAVCQSLSDLPRGLLANFATKIMCRLGTAGDYRQLGGDMGMSADQVHWAQLNTRPGTFVAQLAEGPWRRPFVVHTPKLEIPASVGPEEVSESLEALDHLKVIPAPEFSSWTPHEQVSVSADPVPFQQVPDPPAGLDEAEQRFLQAVRDHPGRPSSAYARLAGMGAQKAIHVRRALVEKGRLREHTVATGMRGRNAIVLEVLEDSNRQEGQD